MGALSWTVAFLDRGGGSAEGLPRTTPSREVALLSNSVAASRNVEGDGASHSHSGWVGHSPSPSPALGGWSSEKWPVGHRARLWQLGLADTEAYILSVPKRRELSQKLELESIKERPRRNRP